jgi:hypothetical protein
MYRVSTGFTYKQRGEMGREKWEGKNGEGRKRNEERREMEKGGNVEVKNENGRM